MPASLYINLTAHNSVFTCLLNIVTESISTSKTFQPKAGLPSWEEG